jgi:hypothetical protein
VLLSMPGPELARPFAEGIHSGAARFGRPVVAAVAAGPRYVADFRSLMAGGPVPVFSSPRRAAVALRAILEVGARSTDRGIPWEPEAAVQGEVPPFLPVDGPCGEVAAKRFFSERGLPVPCGRVATSVEEVRATVRELAFPLVAKTSAPPAVHKTARGLIQAGIRHETEALRAFERIRAATRAAGLVEGADGVLADAVLFEEERAGGAEVFLAARRDPTFGLLIGVGVGGTKVEAVSAVRWELAPLDPGRVAGLIDAARSWRLLDGPGGPRDASALRGAIVAFYEALRSLGERLVEGEINPLAVFAKGEGVSALDAALVLAPPPGSPRVVRGPGDRAPSSASRGTSPPERDPPPDR